MSKPSRPDQLPISRPARIPEYMREENPIVWELPETASMPQVVGQHQDIGGPHSAPDTKGAIGTCPGE